MIVRLKFSFALGLTVYVTRLLFGTSDSRVVACDWMFVFIHPLTCILAEKLSSKSRVFELEFDNQ